MNARRILEFGGIAAGVLMVAFGIGSLVLGINARSTVRDELTAGVHRRLAGHEAGRDREGRSGGRSEQCADPVVRRGGEGDQDRADARCFAQYMRIHALESSGGNTYAQMGRFVAAADPSDPKGTSDEEAAAKDENGKPISNGARNTWVTETALSTALNASYMAEQIGLFSVVVGIALLLSGIGFIILALAVLGGGGRKPADA